MNNSSNSEKLLVELGQLDGDCHRFYYAIAPTIYGVIGTTHMLLCIGGYPMLLLGMIRKAGHQPAYIYQSYLTVGELIAGCFNGVHCLAWLWFLFDASVRRCYNCVFYAVHLSHLIADAFLTVVLLIAVVTAVDRLLRLGKPAVYKTIDHKRLRLFALIFGLIISVSLMAIDLFGSTVVSEPSGYAYRPDRAYSDNVLTSLVVQVRRFVRLICVLWLLLADVSLLMAYRKYCRAMVRIPPSKSDVLYRLSSDRSLILLTVCQCAAAILTTLSSFSMEFGGGLCEIALAHDVTLFLVQLINLLCCLLISKRFERAMAGPKCEVKAFVVAVVHYCAGRLRRQNNVQLTPVHAIE